MDTNVELYVKSKDRWLIDATFPGHQESIAVEDAKQLSSQRHVQAVKVIRETIDPATGAKHEKTVFTTEPEKLAEDYDENLSKQGEEKEDVQKSWMDEIPEELSKAKNVEQVRARKRKKNINKPEALNLKGSLTLKLLTIVIFSCCFAAIITLVFQKFGSNLYNQFGI